MDLVKYVKHPIKYAKLLEEKVFYFLPDEPYLKMLYKHRMGIKLNLDEPQNFTEKLQWLKLYDRNPKYTQLADKLKLKEYVTNKIGASHVVPVLGVWDDANDINFNNLPEKFVLKCNHNSGKGMCICTNKAKLNLDKVKVDINKGLKSNYFITKREWPYKKIERKIFAEEFMQDVTGEQKDCLIDYKFFCFDGVPKVMYIGKDNAEIPTTDYFDMDFNHLDIKTRDQNSRKPIEKPMEFEEMKEFAKILSKGIPHVRVDFYCVNHEIYVGEMTFYHNAGFFKFTPDYWNEKFGNWIDLTKAYNYNQYISKSKPKYKKK